MCLGDAEGGLASVEGKSFHSIGSDFVGMYAVLIPKRRLSHHAFKGRTECALGRIAQLQGKGPDPNVPLSQCPLGKQHAPSAEVSQRWNPSNLAETLRERRPRHGRGVGQVVQPPEGSPGGHAWDRARDAGARSCEHA